MSGESQQVPSDKADPTVLTTEALQREVEALKDLINLRVSGLKDVVDERFTSVDRQLIDQEARRVEQKSDTKAAVDAALAAAKEAVKEQTTASERAIGKSETSTTTAISAVSSNVDDLKERVGKIENLRLGGDVIRADQRGGLASAVGVIGACIGILSLLAAMATIIIATR